MKTISTLSTAALSGTLAIALAACSASSGEEVEQADDEASANVATTDNESLSDNWDGDEGYDSTEEGGQAEASEEDGIVSVSLPDGVTDAMLGDRTKRMIAVQVMLDRSVHSPGVIDGRGGGNTERAIRFYRKDKGLKAGTQVDDELLKALYDDFSGDVFRTYFLTEKDVAGPFYEIPEDFAAKSEKDRLGYRDTREMLAERFHMDQDFLAALNPQADMSKAGTKLTIVSHGKRKFEGDIASIEVRKSDDAVVALNGSGKILASYPATIGSSDFPSPSGNMTVSAVAPKPNYTFDPESQKWGPDKTFILPPGPNNPVGGTWIDLGKNGYGIHGSPDPQLIGKTASHGCVRLTNWDANELAKAVTSGIPVKFI